MRAGFRPLQAVYLWRNECCSLSLPSSAQQWGYYSLPHGLLEDSMRWLMPRTQHSACTRQHLVSVLFSLSPSYFLLRLRFHFLALSICATILDADCCSRICTWLTAGELGADPLSNSHIFILPFLEMSLVRLAPGWGQHPSRPPGTGSASSPSTDAH